MATILKATDLGISFGGLKAVSGFNLSLEENDLVGLIGPNGAGKTTVFNLLTGVYQPTEGAIELEGHSIMGKSPHQLVKLGSPGLSRISVCSRTSRCWTMCVWPSIIK